MDLSAGTRIGPYVVIAPLGAGGMGEVYKAHDSKLGRDVALKVLSAALAVDTHYMSRFRNEAKTLASLNHPNIAQIYGLEGNAIVMELVEGPTLADRISGAAIPIQEAVPIAKQIAEGLEAAHQKGIVHRDLKPANIKVTSQGVVKILDFGLAKVGELKSTANPGSSPTLTVQTQAGVILGTAAYMSPEQAEGHPVDERSDIFSFGAVLYEMVTRTRAFRGTSTVSILAAVLREEPQPVRELNRSIPLRLQLIIHRCLAKHVDKRWQNIIDVKLLLQDMEQEEVSQQNESMARSAKPSRVVRFAAPLFLAAMSAGALGSWIFLTRSRTVAAIDPPAYAQLTSDPGLSFEPAISPDGKLLAYASDRAGEGSLDLWVRQLPNGHPVRITSNKADEREPDFSPDGSKIVFRSDDYGGGISVISPLGGEARKIADRGRQPRFSPDGKWIAYWIGERHQSIFGTVWIVPSGGGEPKEITPPEGAGEDPVWAPDSKGVIVLGRILPEPGKPTSPFADGIGWAYLPIDGSEPKMIITDPELRSFGLSPPPLYSHLRPAAFINQRIVFSAKLGGTSTLWGLPVSASTRRASGSPVPLTSGPGLHVHPGAAMATPKRRYVFSALSLRSSIVSVPATTVGSKTLTSPRRWTDGLDVNTHPSISMDGSTLAYISNRSSNPDVWLKNLRTGRETALTETPWAESYARISPNSSQVMFIALRESGKRVLGWVQSVGGIPRTYCTDCEGTLFGGWIDEHTFVYTTNKGLSLMRMPSGKSAELVEGPVLEPRASYDGHWIVFHSSPQPTIRQIFVAPVRGGIVPKEDWIQITGESGMNRNAAWAPDGRRVYFLSDRDGFRCIWAQNLDAKSKRPVGEPFALHHSHSARFSLFNFIGQGLISISATQDQVFFAEPEITGNVWMMETAER